MSLEKKEKKFLHVLRGARPLPPIVILPDPYNNARRKLSEALIKPKLAGSELSRELLNKEFHALANKVPENMKEDLLINLNEMMNQSQIRSHRDFIELVKNFFNAIFLEGDSLTPEQTRQISRHIDDLLNRCNDKQRKVFSWVVSGLAAILYHKKGVIDGSTFNPFLNEDLQKRIYTDSHLELANKCASLATSDTVFDLQKIGLSSYCRIFKVIFLKIFNDNPNRRKSYEDFYLKINDPKEEGLLQSILVDGPDILNRINQSMSKKSKKALLKDPQLFLESPANGLITADLFSSEINIREMVAFLVTSGTSTILPKVEAKPIEEQAAVNFLSYQTILSLFGSEDNLKTVFLSWFIKVFFRAENIEIRGELSSRLTKEIVLPASVMLGFFSLTYLFPHITKEGSFSTKKNKDKEIQRDEYRIYAIYCLKNQELDPLIKKLYDKAKQIVGLLHTSSDLSDLSKETNETLVQRGSRSPHLSLESNFDTHSEKKKSSLKIKLSGSFRASFFRGLNNSSDGNSEVVISGPELVIQPFVATHTEIIKSHRPPIPNKPLPVVPDKEDEQNQNSKRPK